LAKKKALAKGKPWQKESLGKKKALAKKPWLSFV
jgi:hypothetical protein